MTQKEIIRTHKEATRLYVVTFHEVTGVRMLSYGNLDPVTALAFITQQLFIGRRVVITDEYGDRQIMTFEQAQHRRIEYHEATSYRITINNDLTQF